MSLRSEGGQHCSARVQNTGHLAGGSEEIACWPSQSTPSRLTLWVPCAEHNTPVGGVILNLVNDLHELVHALARIVVLAGTIVGAKVPPLEPIHGSQVAFPPVTETDAVEVLPAAVACPDVDALVGEHLAVGAARDKPEKLLNHAAGEHALGGEQGEGVVGQREAQRVGCEQRKRAGAGTVGAGLASRDDARDQVEILILLCAG